MYLIFLLILLSCQHKEPAPIDLFDDDGDLIANHLEKDHERHLMNYPKPHADKCVWEVHLKNGQKKVTPFSAKDATKEVITHLTNTQFLMGSIPKTYPHFSTFYKFDNHNFMTFALSELHALYLDCQPSDDFTFYFKYKSQWKLAAANKREHRYYFQPDSYPHIINYFSGNNILGVRSNNLSFNHLPSESRLVLISHPDNHRIEYLSKKIDFIDYLKMLDPHLKQTNHSTQFLDLFGPLYTLNEIPHLKLSKFWIFMNEAHLASLTWNDEVKSNLITETSNLHIKRLKGVGRSITIFKDKNSKLIFTFKIKHHNNLFTSQAKRECKCSARCDEYVCCQFAQTDYKTVKSNTSLSHFIKNTNIRLNDQIITLRENENIFFLADNNEFQLILNDYVEKIQLELINVARTQKVGIHDVSCDGRAFIRDAYSNINEDESYELEGELAFVSKED